VFGKSAIFTSRIITFISQDIKFATDTDVNIIRVFMGRNKKAIVGYYRRNSRYQNRYILYSTRLNHSIKRNYTITRENI